MPFTVTVIVEIGFFPSHGYGWHVSSEEVAMKLILLRPAIASKSGVTLKVTTLLASGAMVSEPGSAKDQLSVPVDDWLNVMVSSSLPLSFKTVIENDAALFGSTAI